MSHDNKQHKTISGSTYRTTNRRGAKKKPPELKIALRFSVNLTGIEAAVFLKKLAKSGMKRQEYARTALVLYSNKMMQVDG